MRTRGIEWTSAARRGLLAAAAMSVALAGMAPAALADGNVQEATSPGTGEIAVNGRTGVSYEGHQLFSAVVDDGTGAMSYVSFADGYNTGEFLSKLDSLGYGDWRSGNGYTFDGARESPQVAAEFVAHLLSGYAGGATVEASSNAGALARWVEANVRPVGLVDGANVLGEGYWMLDAAPIGSGTDMLGTAPVFTTVGGDVTKVTVKIEQPSLAKEVQEEGDGSWGGLADEGFGEPVSFRLTATLPGDLGAYTAYALKFTDELPAGQALVRLYPSGAYDLRVLLADGTDVTERFTALTSEERDGQPTVLTVGCDDILPFTYDAGRGVLSDKVILEYRVYPDGDATTGLAHPNVNKAFMTYSNDPLDTSSRTRTVEVTADVYCWNVELLKVDRATLQEVQEAGFKFTVKDVDAGLYVQADGSLRAEAYAFETDGDGRLTVPRIDSGTYEVTEVAVPDGSGYSLPSGDDAKGTLTVTFGKVPDLKLSAQAVGANLMLDTDTVENGVDASNGTVYVKFGDPEQVPMPITGMGGVALLSAVGLAVTGVSVAAVVRRRRAEG